MIEEQIKILSAIQPPRSLKENILSRLDLEQQDHWQIVFMRRLALASVMVLFLSFGLFGKTGKSMSMGLEYALITGQTDYQTVVMSKY